MHIRESIGNGEFFAAFLQDRKLSKKEAERIKKMITNQFLIYWLVSDHVNRMINNIWRGEKLK